MDDILRERLAESPPGHWAEVHRRAQVVREYLALPSPSLEELERHAAKLDLRPRMFYNLVRSFRDHAAGLRPAPSRQGQHSQVPADVSRAIEDALARLPAGANLKEARRRAEALCVERGLPTPSSHAVRNRFAREPSTPDLIARLDLDADLLMDASVLDLDVTGDGRTLAACLVALIDLRRPRILAHRLTVGQPTTGDLNMLIDAAQEVYASRITVLAAAPKLAGLLAEGGTRMAGCVTSDRRRRPLRLGAGLIATVGLRLGRVPLAPRRRSDAPRTTASVPVDDARGAIALLIAARNAELDGSAEPGRPPCDVRVGTA